MFDDVGGAVGRDAEGVAQRARAEERQDDVGAAADAPDRERLTEVFVMLLEADI